MFSPLSEPRKLAEAPAAPEGRTYRTLVRTPAASVHFVCAHNYYAGAAIPAGSPIWSSQKITCTCDDLSGRSAGAARTQKKMRRRAGALAPWWG